MYIADTYNERVRKVTVSTGIISTIAGTGASSYSGDNGPATSAALCSPTGVSLDASGIVHFYLFFYLLLFFFPFLHSYFIQATCTSLIIIIIVSVR